MSEVSKTARDDTMSSAYLRPLLMELHIKYSNQSSFLPYIGESDGIPTLAVTPQALSHLRIYGFIHKRHLK